MNAASTDHMRDLQELFEQIPPAEGREMLILRGHLVVEQFLWRYIEQHVANPAALRGSRISFAMLTNFAEALCPRSGTTGVNLWNQIRDLNRIRNVLAHKLSPTDMQAHIDQLLRGYETSLGANLGPQYMQADEFGKLRLAIRRLCVFIIGYVVAARLS
jgi:hypothetical protein